MEAAAPAPKPVVVDFEDDEDDEEDDDDEIDEQLDSLSKLHDKLEDALVSAMGAKESAVSQMSRRGRCTATVTCAPRACTARDRSRVRAARACG